MVKLASLKYLLLLQKLLDSKPPFSTQRAQPVISSYKYFDPESAEPFLPSCCFGDLLYPKYFVSWIYSFWRLPYLTIQLDIIILVKGSCNICHTIAIWHDEQAKLSHPVLVFLSKNQWLRVSLDWVESYRTRRRINMENSTALSVTQDIYGRIYQKKEFQERNAADTIRDS